MGSMAGGGGGTQTKSKSDPWAPWQPYLKDVLSEAQGTYQSGAPQFWEGSANAGLTPEMQQALGSIWNRASSGSDVLRTAQDTTQAIAGGQMAGANPAYDFLTGQVYGPNANPAMAGAMGLAYGGPSGAGIDALSREASGQNVGKNPWLDATYRQGADQLEDTFRNTTVPQLNSDYALSGRTGSHAYADAIGRARGNVMDSAQKLATGIYGGAYNTDRGIQAQAEMAMPGAYSQDFQNRIAGQNFLSGIYDTGLQRQLYGAQMLGQLGQQDVTNALNAANMAPGMASSDYTDLNAMQSVAQANQQRAQSEQDLARQRWDYNQTSPMNWLNQYASLVYGAPLQGFGTQQSTTTQVQGQGQKIGSMIGGGLGLASAAFGVPPQMGMGMGSGLGSMFGGLFG